MLRTPLQYSGKRPARGEHGTLARRPHPVTYDLEKLYPSFRHSSLIALNEEDPRTKEKLPLRTLKLISRATELVKAHGNTALWCMQTLVVAGSVYFLMKKRKIVVAKHRKLWSAEIVESRGP